MSPLRSTRRPSGALAQVALFVKLGRPQFLVGGLLLYALGVALARVAGATVDWQRYAAGQAVITSSQWMTHYSNDYFDLAADRVNATPTRWSGGSRVLPSGALPPRVALVAALSLAACAVGSTLWAAHRAAHAPFVVPLACSIVALSWAYSAPPWRLLGRGLGELTTALVVTLLTPLLGFYLQTGTLTRSLVLACLPLCGLQFSMLLTVELPDAAGDTRVGKRTLVVRHGARLGAHWAAGLVVASFGLLPLCVLVGLPAPVAAGAALSAPLALWHAARLIGGAFRDSRYWPGLAFTSVSLLAGTALGELAGALLAIK